ncbi:UbiA family prenyltransferase [Microbacterium xanthum]|uniref:UbiA family prenyltransferase n=1 Tax=Microbacterium xanthum TaxID=3079794 RepID=UPI002AD43D53|nr:UbiA family prenyltransferase [Microbacterium sp. KSW-48]MDZ8172974.1 UbiA family prenyltransferase [Microbacterium sp. KSW-48]
MDAADRRRRSPGRVLAALAGSSHPGPTVVVTLLALALGIAAGVSAVDLMLLVSAVLFGQLSVGISNDVLDVRRDRAVGRSDKPLARGDASPGQAWAAAVICLILALGLSAMVGIGMLAAHAVFLASAWAYNAGLKATPISIVPFIVGFGVFPSLAPLSAEPPAPAAPWAWIAGGALGAAIHLVNVLPDLDDDAQTGIRGFPHMIGARASALLAIGGLFVGDVAALIGPVGGDLSAVTPVAAGFLVAALALTVVTVIVAFAHPRARVLFTLVMAAALLLAVQLIATGGSLAS